MSPRLFLAAALALPLAGCATPVTPAKLIDGTISNDDYPAAAIRAQEEGISEIRFTVDEQGLVRDCTITRSSGSEALDYAACSLVQRRFRYQPAMRGGRPLTENRSQRIVWRLPR